MGRIRNKNGDTAQDLVKDEGTLSIFREFQAEKQIARDDIACTSAKSPYTASSYTIIDDYDDDLADGDEGESD